MNHDTNFDRAGIDTALSVLQQRFGDRFTRNEGIRREHGHNVSMLYNQPPDAVVFAESTADVADAVKICAAHRCPVVAFGAGSSIEGQLNAPFGGVSIDLSRMNQVLAVSPGDMTVTVQPGITREALNAYLRDTGLFFPIDPGANASIGGMASTRASGTTAVRYGTMKDVVLAAEAVMADGRTIRTARRAKKSSAGYDLTRLLVGAEGTLGIMTELTLRVFGIPEMISGGVCTFPSVRAACEAVMATIQAGIPIARCELLDENQIRACNAYSKLSLEEQPTLCVEFHGSPSSVAEQSELFGEIALEYGSPSFEWSTDPDRRNKLWRARHDGYWAAVALRPGCEVYSTDVCVPISRLAECVEETQKDLADMGLFAPILGHVGDGNFHVLLSLDTANAAEMKRSEEFSARLVERALSMDGTCTGEHGIGQRKPKYLRKEMGDAVDFMQSIKAALDPQNILNPGKYGF